MFAIERGPQPGCACATLRSRRSGSARLALRHNRDHELGDLWGFCRTCYYADICRGGCTWTSDALLGRPGNNPYCHHRALELAGRGLRERVVRVADAPGLPFDRARFELVTEPAGS